MPHEPATETAVSAPGKVLFTGGYLVLDRQYTGGVFALDARVHVVVQQLQKDKEGKLSKRLSVESGAGTGSGTAESGRKRSGEEETEEVVIVRSPQFVDALWEYRVLRAGDGGGIKVEQVNESSVPRNNFVETSLNYALTYINYVAASTSFGSLSVTILADNDYYSETAASVQQSVAAQGHGHDHGHGGPGARFRKAAVQLHEAHKTGLGSSAALVTSLVSALVAHRTVHPDTLHKHRSKLHNLAQAAHCAAQGKVGSGFDVAAAIFGSCMYRRFSPSVLAGLGDVGSPQFEARLFSVVEDLNSDSKWDFQCGSTGAHLPPGLQMILCDVEAGSQTPGMVRKVLAWREKNRNQASQLWDELQIQNERFHREIARLKQIEPTCPPDFGELPKILHGCRTLIRKMTDLTQVPIEPRVQTALIDALSEVDGVLGGVVPGAGGYDAIALLVRDEGDVVLRLRSVLQNWKCPVQDDFGGELGRVNLLSVTHGTEGVKGEPVARYADWL